MLALCATAACRGMALTRLGRHDKGPPCALVTGAAAQRGRVGTDAAICSIW